MFQGDWEWAVSHVRDLLVHVAETKVLGVNEEVTAATIQLSRLIRLTSL